MDENNEAGNNNQLDDDISEDFKNLLKQIKEVWEDLKQEPKGRHASNYIALLPPSQEFYWQKLDKLNELVKKVIKDFSDQVLINYPEFFHTLHKEGEYVRGYTYNNRLSEKKNQEKLSSLMIKANGHIYRDLFGIFQKIENLNTLNNETL